ncbi:hypothetical protein KSC_088340 [Ktedonobacter sp. SOSP1-52]|nr:hypothetical protein KSC_088340 [Ktedonobacter sp. SOSP1-52]
MQSPGVINNCFEIHSLHKYPDPWQRIECTREQTHLDLTGRQFLQADKEVNNKVKYISLQIEAEAVRLGLRDRDAR